MPQTHAQPAKLEISTLNQEQFKETAYQDQSYEVLGERQNLENFEPLEMQVLEGDEFLIDPMFRNFGGLPEQKTIQRWHLPENLAYKSPNNNNEKKEQEEIEQSIKLKEEELAAVKAASYEAGHKAGLEEAVAINLEKMQQVEQNLQGMLADLQKQMAEQVQQLEKAAVELSLQISKKLIASNVEFNPEYIIEIVREALSKCGAATIRKIKVSPQDMEFIKIVGIAKEFKEHQGDWQFEADPEVQSGCIVETSAGEMDFQLDKAWDRVAENVIKVMR